MSEYNPTLPLDGVSGGDRLEPVYDTSFSSNNHSRSCGRYKYRWFLKDLFYKYSNIDVANRIFGESNF